MATPGAGGMGAAGAGGGGPDGNWRATQFRSKVVGQINDALREACNPIEKSGSELEEHIFNRARDRDSYLSLVARLILHMRDSNAAKEKGLPGRMTPNMAGQQQEDLPGEFMSRRTAATGSSYFARYVEETLSKLPGVIRRNAEANIMRELHRAEQAAGSQLNTPDPLAENDDDKDLSPIQ